MTARAPGERAWFDAEGDFKVGKAIIVSCLALILMVVVSVAGCAGCKSYERYQKRADAINKTAIVKQGIKTAQQQALVNKAQIAATIAEAQKRREEAKGLRDAQDTVQATLTPLYIQHEAIQAQKETASSGQNNTVIYVPSGSNGVPLVQTPPLKRSLAP